MVTWLRTGLRNKDVELLEGVLGIVKQVPMTWMELEGEQRLQTEINRLMGYVLNKKLEGFGGVEGLKNVEELLYEIILKWRLISRNRNKEPEKLEGMEGIKVVKSLEGKQFEIVVLADQPNDLRRWLLVAENGHLEVMTEGRLFQWKIFGGKLGHKMELEGIGGRLRFLKQLNGPDVPRQSMEFWLATDWRVALQEIEQAAEMEETEKRKKALKI